MRRHWCTRRALHAYVYASGAAQHDFLHGAKRLCREEVILHHAASIAAEQMKLCEPSVASCATSGALLIHAAPVPVHPPAHLARPSAHPLTCQATKDFTPQQRSCRVISHAFFPNEFDGGARLAAYHADGASGGGQESELQVLHSSCPHNRTTHDRERRREQRRFFVGEDTSQ